jgi:hypothetical protein
LKQCIDRAGYSDVTCIEKKDMVDLVLKLYARYRRSSKQAAEDRQQPSTASTSEEEETDATSASKAGSSRGLNGSKPAPVDTSDMASTTASGRHSPTPKGRRRSEGDVFPAAKYGEEDMAESGTESPPLLPSMKSSTSSIISDAELARRLSIDRPSDAEDELDSAKPAK